MEDVQVIVERVRSATVIVATGPPGAGEAKGSGFFVAPGRVVTCAHVTEEAGATPHVWWHGRSAAATVDAATPAPASGGERVGDAAVLRIADTDHACVPLGRAATAATHQMVWAYGITRLRRGSDRPPEFDGSVGEITLTAAAPGSKAANPYITVDNRIAKGMSGGPLVNLSTFGVCGIIQSRAPNADTGGWAVPIEVALRLGGLEGLLDDAPGDPTSLATLRSSQLGFGRLPALVAARLSASAADVLRIYLTEPPLNRARPPLPNDNDGKEWLARQLFTLSLPQLVGALHQVIGELGAVTARRVFNIVAPCLPVGADPPWWWIAGDAAATLRAELDLRDPRLVHIATDEDRSITVLLERAYEAAVMVERCGGAASAEVGAGGMPKDVEDDVLSAIETKFGGRPGELAASAINLASELRDTNTFVRLDLGEAPDLVQMQDILGAYPGVRFLVCRPKLTPPAGAESVLLVLQPPVDPANEQRALKWLRDFEQRVAALT